MRTLVGLAILVCGALPLHAETPSTIATLGRAARGRGGETLAVSFQADACTLTTATAAATLVTPLRQVSWSLGNDGSGDAIVTARCIGGKRCVGDGEAGTPRMSMRLAMTAKAARTMLAELKALKSHCAPASR